MLGAIVGDIVGSSHFEMKVSKVKLIDHESYYSDDTILTLATAESLLSNIPYMYKYRQYAKSYPDAGYGHMFEEWVHSNGQAYNSFGNGSAMRVSPIGWYFDSLNEVLDEARKSAECTHNHPEGIKGAQAVAAAIFLARTGKGKGEIKSYIASTFNYDLSVSLRSLQESYEYSETCQQTIPPALIAFFESFDFEDSLRKTISIGGDVDTLCAINGSIAHAFYGEIDPTLLNDALSVLGADLRNKTLQFNNQIVRR